MKRKALVPRRVNWLQRVIHPLIVKYLDRVGGAFHCFPYGKNGRYVVLMNDSEYHWYRNGEDSEAIAQRLDEALEANRKLNVLKATLAERIYELRKEVAMYRAAEDDMKKAAAAEAAFSKTFTVVVNNDKK